MEIGSDEDINLRFKKAHTGYFRLLNRHIIFLKESIKVLKDKTADNRKMFLGILENCPGETLVKIFNEIHDDFHEKYPDFDKICLMEQMKKQLKKQTGLETAGDFDA